MIFVQAGLAGPLQRVANTTLQMPSAPPSVGYTSTNAFPNLVFTNPVCIANPPGETNRLFVLEKRGVIVVITNLAAPTRTIFLDASSKVISGVDTNVFGEEGMLGLAFHPGYATNRYFYVFYTGLANTSDGNGRHDILSRFQTTATNANVSLSSSETRFILQFDEVNNHNGGDLHFGPDGYLYVALGDEGGDYGQEGNSQHIDKDFFSAIMRLDVDKRPGSVMPHAHPALPALTNYAVPPDNPYVGATTFNGLTINSNAVRTEFWAVGMRNPWRFSFDPVTQALYVGHVGQVTLESIAIVTNKANCGWNFYEGTLQLTNPLPPGFTLTPPIFVYGHTNGRVAVVGGVVYRGARIPQLYGTYLYADLGSGEVFGLRNSGSTVTANDVLFIDTAARVSSFGVDPSNGDVLCTALRNGIDSTINRIIYSGVTNGGPLPPTLADTGAFTNLNSLTRGSDLLLPAAGIVPYDLNVPFWSDNAIKTRWVSVPDTNLTIGFSSNANWTFPTGTVWIKHFNLEMTNGVPSSARRVETRLLVKNASGVYGAVYRWGNSVTNATLLSENGMDEPFVIHDGGVLRTQVWHYPSRNECALCHTPQGGFALGFRSEQLNRDFNYGRATTNQIAAFSDAGYFSAPVNDRNGLLALAAATNGSASLEFRVRSYLAANCAQCHQPGGSTPQAHWDARINTPTALAGIIYGDLGDHLGSLSNHVITPLSLSNSVLLTRISARDLGSPGGLQMPPLDSNLLDTQAIAMVTQWISSLSNTFWMGVSPDSQTVSIGGPTNSVTVMVLTTPDFSTPIALTLGNLPVGISAAFGATSVVRSNQVSLSFAASASATPGNYSITVQAAAAGQTNSATIGLAVANPFTTPGALQWSAGGGADTNWGNFVNWTNVTAHTNGLPGPLNDVIFSRAGAGAAAGQVSNVVDTTTTIKSLWYLNGSGASTNHTTRINPGVSLNVIGSTNITGGAGFASDNFALLVGTNGSTAPTMSVKVTGAGGTLSINSTGLVHVAQFNIATKHAGANLRAILDLSGLDTFNANVGRFLLGSMSNGSAGEVYLARTNRIVLSGAVGPQLDLADNDVNQGDPSILYLGITNALFADSISAGRSKGTNGSIFFNPAFSGQNPTAYFRGQNGIGRVSTWIIGDLASASGTADVTKPTGTNDFSGGTVDAMVDTLVLARTTTVAPGNNASSNRVSTGTLTISGGTFDVNNLTNALQLANAKSGTASWDTAAGQININGGTLRVNNNLVVASSVAGLLPAFVRGNLAVRNGTVSANRIIPGGGTAMITLTNAVLDVTNAMSATPRLTALAITNSTLRLRVNGQNPVAGLSVTNFTLAGANSIVIDSVANVGIPLTIPLIAYTTFTGSLSNVALSLPQKYLGALTNNAVGKTIDLLLTRSSGPPPRINSISVVGTNLLIGGTNGFPNWRYLMLSSTNITLPLASWKVESTNTFDPAGAFISTNAVDGTSPKRFYLLKIP